MMKGIFAVALVGLGCSDDANIEPDPTSSSGTNVTSSSGATSSSTGAGGDGQGGAGGNGMVGGGFESGSRLKVRTLVGTDGTRQPAGWHDNELGVDCSFREDALGTQRCLPLAHPTAYHTDSSCSNPVAYFACGAPTHAHAEVRVGCGLAVNIHEIGAPTTVPPDIYIRNGNGQCQFGGITPLGTFYALGAPIAASSFVQASYEVEP